MTSSICLLYLQAVLRPLPERGPTLHSTALGPAGSWKPSEIRGYPIRGSLDSGIRRFGVLYLGPLVRKPPFGFQGRVGIHKGLFRSASPGGLKPRPGRELCTLVCSADNVQAVRPKKQEVVVFCALDLCRPRCRDLVLPKCFLIHGYMKKGALFMWMSGVSRDVRPYPV